MLYLGGRMHFNVYIDDQIGLELKKFTKKSGKKRNAIIREALAEWLHHHVNKEWPPEFFAFTGISDAIPFEAYRKQLTPPKEDPFA